MVILEEAGVGGRVRFGIHVKSCVVRLLPNGTASVDLPRLERRVCARRALNANLPPEAMRSVRRRWAEVPISNLISLFGGLQDLQLCLRFFLPTHSLGGEMLCGSERSLSWADESGFVGGDDELRAVSGAELAPDPAHMCLGGARAHEELFGDLGVVVSSLDLDEYLPFSVGEVGQDGGVAVGVGSGGGPGSVGLPLDLDRLRIVVDDGPCECGPDGEGAFWSRTSSGWGRQVRGQMNKFIFR